MKTSIACGVFLFLIQGLSYVNAQPSFEDPWCPSGWETDGNNCYDIYVSTLFYHSWSDAELLCQLSYLGNDPHLASIHSQSEMDFVYAMVQSRVTDGYGTWFGLRKNGDTYSNADDTYQTWFRWDEGQPDMDSSCVGIYAPVVNPDGEWYDADCNDPAHYVCQMPMLPPEDPCPDGGEPYLDSCYTFHLDDKQTLSDARAMCSAETKNLISIELPEENDYVAGTLTDGENWLGMSINNDTGEWTWDDPGAGTGYSNWLSGYPNDESACAVSNTIGQWWTHTAQECATLEAYVVCKGALGGAASVTVGYFIITAALMLSKIF